MPEYPYEDVTVAAFESALPQLVNKVEKAQLPPIPIKEAICESGNVSNRSQQVVEVLDAIRKSTDSIEFITNRIKKKKNY